MKIKQVLGKVRKTVDEYNLIEDGDKIVVGISGGKDSITLFTCLAMLKNFYPKKFELGAIAIDLFNGQTDYTETREYCKKFGVDLVVINSNIKKIVFDIKKETNPCALCANLRRGYLNTNAKKLGYNKVALGHHADDLMETFFMSLFYESRLNTFSPIMQLTNNNLKVIRPMITVFEKDIISVSKDMPVVKNQCPADKHTQREYMKNLIKKIAKDIPGVNVNILSAITHPERYNLYDKFLNKKWKIYEKCPKFYVFWAFFMQFLIIFRLFIIF